jgi:hypothetical protein
MALWLYIPKEECFEVSKIYNRTIIIEYEYFHLNNIYF